MRSRLSMLVLAALGTATFAAHAAPETAKPIPVEAFADSPFFDTPVISPDGQRFAARAYVEDTTKILIMSATGDQTIKRISLGKMSASEIRWAGSDRLLIRVAVPTTFMGAKVSAHRLIAIDLKAGTHSLLDSKSNGLVAGDVLYIHPDGGWLLVASQNDIFSYPSVKRIDLANGNVSVIERARENVWDWYADRSGIVRAGIAYSGDRWTMWYRPDATAPLKPIKGRNRADGEDGTVESVRFLPAVGKGVVITNAKTGRFAAYRYDFTTAQIGDALYEHPDVDISAIRINSDTGEVDGVSYTADRFHIAWLDPKLAAIQARIDRALPNAENIVLNVSRDNNRMIVWSGAAHNPGTYYLYDRPSRQLQTLGSPISALDGIALAKVEPVRFPARDGLSIPGYLTLPTGKGDHNLPLIVMPHGGPHARDTWDYDPWVQFLASRGYVVLQPNFRGSTGYGKDYVERGYGQWGRSMQDDIDDGVAWLVKRRMVDPKRICIFGASYGGYAALWGAIRNPETYRCAVSVAGVTDIPAMLKYDRRMFSATRYYRAWEQKVRGLEKLDLSLVSPLAQAGRLTIPVMIAHGDDDTNVPAKQSRQMIDALAKGKAPVESVFYPDEGHTFSKRESKLDLLKRLEAFLTKYNPA